LRLKAPGSTAVQIAVAAAHRSSMLSPNSRCAAQLGRVQFGVATLKRNVALRLAQLGGWLPAADYERAAQ
jgi:hypothetical protein